MSTIDNKKQKQELVEAIIDLVVEHQNAVEKEDLYTPWIDPLGFALWKVGEKRRNKTEEEG